MRRCWTVNPWYNIGKGDHKHNGRSYTTHVTKMGWLITRKSKHVKPTQVTSEQYPWDQLDKCIVKDHLEGILKHIEKQTPMNHTNTKKEQPKTFKRELIRVTHNKKA